MIASFLITFREALEAALIVGIVAAHLGKIERRDLNKYLYAGTAGAVLASMALGWMVLTIYGGLPSGADKLFEGAASVTATVVLTCMIFWMAKNAQMVKGELEEKVDIAITSGYLFGITALAFVAVLREGLETVLFLTALAAADPWETLAGAVVGVIMVVFLAVLMMKGVYRLDIKRFFKYTSLILLVFAAGLLGYGVHELVEAGLLPPIIEHVWDIKPP